MMHDRNLTKFLASLLLGTACLATFAGCEPTAQDLDLDPAAAHSAFQTFLEAWRDGKTPEQLREGNPPIITRDPDWAAGHKLTAFQVAPEESNDGTNLHLTADLELTDLQGRKNKQRVTYVVGTDPQVTIFRE